MTVQNDIDVSNIKHQNRQRDSPYPLAVAVAVAAAAAVAVAVSDMAGEERISAGTDVSCFAVASGKLWRRRLSDYARPTKKIIGSRSFYEFVHSSPVISPEYV